MTIVSNQVDRGVSAQKLATFDYVQDNPLLCCLGRKKVKSAAVGRADCWID